MTHPATAPRALLVALTLGAILSAPADARARKLGKNSVVDQRHGYVMRLAEKFEALPLQPGEKQVIKKYTGPETTSGWSTFSPTLEIVWIPKVDEDEAVVTEDGEEVEIPEDLRKLLEEAMRAQVTDVRTWLTSQYRGATITGEQELKGKLKAKLTPPGGKRAKKTKIDGTLIHWSSPTNQGDTAFSGIGLIVPTERGEFGIFYCHTSEGIDDWRKAFQQSVLSFQLRDRARVDKIDEEASFNEFDGEAFRKARKAKLTEGWRTYETPNYLIIHHVDKDLARKLGGRLEGCRRLYEKMFPPKDDRKAVSVVRVCEDRNEYHKDGGPGGSAGYWSRWDKELVFYEAQGKKDTFAVLHHEAFHQYIYYCYGELAPHSWYNEGHGDYFSGVKFSDKHSPVREKPFAWRTDSVKEYARKDQLVPLEEFIHYTQMQYYTRPNLCYSQGWAFVYFLRASDRMRPEWKQILPRYMDALWKESEAVRLEKEAEEAADKAKAEKEAAGEGDPAGGDPAGGDPAGGDPAGGDPAGGDPAGGDPAGGGPAGGGDGDGAGEGDEAGEGEGDEDEDGGMDARFGQFDEDDRILKAAVTAAFEGIDLTELERAFHQFIENGFKDR